MTNFKLLSLAAILSTAIVTPVFAQQAVDEPGAQAFYQSLGVGSHDGPTASAMASARGSYASAPAKRISAKHYARAHKGEGRATKSVPNPKQKAVRRNAFAVKSDVAFRHRVEWPSKREPASQHRFGLTIRLD